MERTLKKQGYTGGQVLEVSLDQCTSELLELGILKFSNCKLVLGRANMQQFAASVTS